PYALGSALSRTPATFNLPPSELETVEAGLSDGLFSKEKKVEIDKYGQKIQELAQARSKAAAEKEKEAAKPFLEKMAQEKGAKKLDSGVIYIEEKAGTGDLAKPTDKVKVHYTGKLIDGTVFDSSVERGQPATFPLNQVIKCWTEGVALMKPGGKAKLICPADVAYGDRGAPPKIKPGSTLQFDVELLEIVKEQPPAGAPPRSAPQPDAKKEEPKKGCRCGRRRNASGRCRVVRFGASDVDAALGDAERGFAHRLRQCRVCVDRARDVLGARPVLHREHGLGDQVRGARA